MTAHVGKLERAAVHGRRATGECATETDRSSLRGGPDGSDDLRPVPGSRAHLRLRPCLHTGDGWDDYEGRIQRQKSSNDDDPCAAGTAHRITSFRGMHLWAGRAVLDPPTSVVRLVR